MALASSKLKPHRSVSETAWFCVAVGLGAAAATALLAEQTLGLGSLYVYKVLAALVGVGAVVAWQAPRHLGTHAFGAANRVTLARAAGVALAAGALGEAATPALAWFVTGVAFGVLVLDGVDGWLARAQGTASRFGARFDMETDALLALVLALLAFQFGRAGAVVLVAGVMRYAFMAAGLVVPRLGRPLPASRRRQSLCVVQIGALALCLVPWFAGPVGRALALAAVAAVVVSFAIDVRRLVGGEAARES